MILSQKTRIALDELETHLRDDITEQMRSGLDGSQAFQLAFQPFWPDDASVMRKLPTEEMRHVKAAEGWLELGNVDEANAELEQIAPELRAHPSVLDLRWKIYAAAGHWKVAIELAEVVAKALPMDRAELFNSLALYACRLDRREDARV